MDAILKKLGLSKGQSSVYMYLLTYGAHSVSDIAQGTGLHRPSVYTAAGKLQEAGLVATQPKGKRILYAVENPAKLLDVANAIAEEVEESLPELQELYRERSAKPILKFFEGRKGIGMVFHDVVNTLGRGEVFYRCSSASDQKRSSSYVPRGYRKKRDNKSLERFVITNKKAAGLKKPRLERAWQRKDSLLQASGSVAGAHAAGWSNASPALVRQRGSAALHNDAQSPSHKPTPAQHTSSL